MTQELMVIANTQIQTVGAFLGIAVAILAIGASVSAAITIARKCLANRLCSLDKEILIEMNGEQQLHPAIVRNYQRSSFSVQVNGRKFSRKDGSKAAKNALASLESLMSRGFVSKKIEGELIIYELTDQGFRASRKLKR